ncbi:M23 family metallopeptidase [Streptomyces sp. RFCAC02]|uniref:M23 family metallopeptidase n=1 Tax=Streptomyces sp. RFCAC02 TaxID=2499143 RepID=UPI0010202952|nr:M23 family metallopeptidase [Streptomyces sp. RFCAC02]
MPNSTTLRSLNLRLRSRAGVALSTGLIASLGVTGAALTAGGGHDTAPATEAESHEQAAPSWTTPIHEDDYTLSATYGNSGDRWASKHSGQDFAVPTGTDVQAAHGGTVVKAGGNGAGDGPAYGNAVVVRHDDDTYTQYAHLSEIDVAVGQKVTTGETIAESGDTGNSSGPHLHFEVRTTPDYGSAVDPMAFLHHHDVDA